MRSVDDARWRTSFRSHALACECLAGVQSSKFEVSAREYTDTLLDAKPALLRAGNGGLRVQLSGDREQSVCIKNG